MEQKNKPLVVLLKSALKNKKEKEQVDLRGLQKA